MTAFLEPTKWAQTLGQDADVVIIPDTSGETDPSIDKLFPSVFSIPLAQGGRAIPRSVLNGFFKLLGDWSFYQQNGGLASYSADFDYTVGRVVLYNDNIYKCIQANGASSTVKVPTETAYWSKITTLADVANAFANQDLSNLSATGLAKFANPSLSNINNTAKIAIAHNAMPSNVYDDLTLGASNDSYIAPADGYFFFRKISTAAYQYVSLVVNNTSRMVSTIYSSNVTQGLTAIMPVKKGDEVLVGYTATGDTGAFRFVYAVGSESEQ